MVVKYQLPVKVIGCEIFRENDGLAMSSRNVLLTSEQRKSTPFIYKTLKNVREKFETDSINDCIVWVKSEFEKQPLLKLEYFQIADEETLQQSQKKNPKKNYRAFIAVFVVKVRLIDNIKLSL